MEEEHKKSQFLAEHAKLLPPDGADEIHPRAGLEAPSCAAREGLAAGEQRCFCLHSLTLRDAASSYCLHSRRSTKTALKLNLLLFFFFPVGSLNQCFRVENAEISSGDKTCLTKSCITAFATCRQDVWFPFTACFLYSNPVLTT